MTASSQNSLDPNQPGVQPDRIDIQSDASLAEWAEKLDTTEAQLRDAVERVGDRATDVEMDLKGSRSTTNTERVDELGAGD
jgi:hypothetical protein